MAWKKRAAGDGETVRYTTLKVRLYPTKAQADLFENTFGCCRYIWNRMLADEQRFYLETDQHFIPTPAKYKKEAPFLKEVDNQALIQEHNKLAQAFRMFFKPRRPLGTPISSAERPVRIPSPPATMCLSPAPPSTPPGTASA